MFTDRAFYHPLYKSIEAYLQYADTKYNPVYFYRFAYKGPASYSIIFTGTMDDFGVGHLDDLIYMFRTPPLFPEFPKNSPYAAVIKDLIDTLVNFAKEGWVDHREGWISTESNKRRRRIKNLFRFSFLFYRKPLIWNEMSHCDKDHQGDTCDYQEFRNSPPGSQQHEIRTEDKFDMKMVEFWDDILNNWSVEWADAERLRPVKVNANECCVWFPSFYDLDLVDLLIC